MLRLVKIAKTFQRAHIRFIGPQAIVQALDSCTLLIEQQDKIQDQRADFSGVVMVFHLYKKFSKR